MKTQKEYFSIGICSLLVLGFIAWFYWVFIWTPTVKVGDVWRYTYGDAGNPYENVKVINYKVLEVENGWIKCLNLRDSVIDVEEIRFFKHYDLISRGETILIYSPPKKPSN